MLKRILRYQTYLKMKNTKYYLSVFISNKQEEPLTNWYLKYNQKHHGTMLRCLFA